MGRAGLVLESGRCLVQRVQAAEAREWTVESVGPCIAVHDVGVDALGVVVPDAQLVGDARGHVVMHDVGTRDELQPDLESGGRLEIHRDVALAALTTEEGLARQPHTVAVYRLDLDDVGAEITHDHRTERTGKVLTEVDDYHSRQRAHAPAPPAIAVISASE